jgi:hypothetical protein
VIWDLLLGPRFNVISKIKQNSSDMNEIILAPCDVISKIKQHSKVAVVRESHKLFFESEGKI